MGENLAEGLLERVFKAETEQELFAVRLAIRQAMDKGDISDAEEVELLAAAEARLAEIRGKRPKPINKNGKIPR